MTTSINVINSEEFMKIALTEACEYVAKANGRTTEEAMMAYLQGCENVVRQVNELIAMLADEMAKRAA